MEQNFQNQKLIEIDISKLPKGVYLVKIQTKGRDRGKETCDTIITLYQKNYRKLHIVFNFK